MKISQKASKFESPIDLFKTEIVSAFPLISGTVRGMRHFGMRRCHSVALSIIFANLRV